MRETIKNTVWWNYGRTTWQYDVLCLLILAFIFLTPQSWFEGRERAVLPTENAKVTRLLVAPESVPSSLSEVDKLNLIRELSGDPDAQIVNWQTRVRANGSIAHEIEIR